MNKEKIINENKKEVQKKYKYRSVIKPRINYLKKIGWQDDCTLEEYKKEFNSNLSRSNTEFILMRKEVT